MTFYSALRNSILSAAVVVAGHVATAVTVDSDDLLGYLDLSNSNGTSELAGVNFLIGKYNEPPGPLVPSAVNAYALDAGSNVPAPDLPAAISGTKFTTSNTNIDLAGMSYDWLLAKWASGWALYYVGGISGSIELTMDYDWDDISWTKTGDKKLQTGKGDGLSHYTLYNGTRVPDSASTLALLGLGLGALGFVARRRKA